MNSIDVARRLIHIAEELVGGTTGGEDEVVLSAKEVLYDLVDFVSPFVGDYAYTIRTSVEIYVPDNTKSGHVYVSGEGDAEDLGVHVSSTLDGMDGWDMFFGEGHVEYINDQGLWYIDIPAKYRSMNIGVSGIPVPSEEDLLKIQSQMDDMWFEIERAYASIYHFVVNIYDESNRFVGDIKIGIA